MTFGDIQDRILIVGHPKRSYPEIAIFDEKIWPQDEGHQCHFKA
jgi:hypothetical protein